MPLQVRQYTLYEQALWTRLDTAIPTPLNATQPLAGTISRGLSKLHNGPLLSITVLVHCAMGSAGCVYTGTTQPRTCKSLAQLVQACFCRFQQVAALYDSTHSKPAEPFLPCVHHACHMTHFVGAGKRSW